MDIINSPVLFALVPVTIGLVEVVKVTGLPDRFAPISSILIGVALGILVLPTLIDAILGGVIVGLSASGLYSGTRALVRGE